MKNFGSLQKGNLRSLPIIAQGRRNLLVNIHPPLSDSLAIANKYEARSNKDLCPYRPRKYCLIMVPQPAATLSLEQSF